MAIIFPLRARMPCASEMILPAHMPAYSEVFHRPKMAMIDIVQIDNFDPDTNRFNHGGTVTNMLRNGGAHPALKNNISIRSFNVGAPENQTPEKIDGWAGKISNALDSVILQAKTDPASVDVVAIPLQNPVETPFSQAVRHKVNMLLARGIPVVIAAGNKNMENPADPVNLAPNTLASPSAFVVQATAHGTLLESSKPGNVSAEGRSTSFAVPALAPLVGSYKAQGYSLGQIQALVQANLAYYNGTFPPAIGQDVYTAGSDTHAQLFLAQ